MTALPARRAVLAAGAAALASGCAEYGGEDAGPGDGGDGSSSPSAGTAGDVLAGADDVPVGGGLVLKDAKIVVTQPMKGEFKAFSAVCTHQGCLVGKVADGVVKCPCHGSEFSATDGSVTHGPASRPLPPQRITVTGNSVRRA